MYAFLKDLICFETVVVAHCVMMSHVKSIKFNMYVAGNLDVLEKLLTNESEHSVITILGFEATCVCFQPSVS